PRSSRFRILGRDFLGSQLADFWSAASSMPGILRQVVRLRRTFFGQQDAPPHAFASGWHQKRLRPWPVFRNQQSAY
ncbi:MAG: hypothetical protein ACR2NZ_22760, partial [Rubripirellula sp.]